MINMNTILMIKGKKTTMADFKVKFAIDTDERAIVLAQALVKKGKATIHNESSEEDDLIALLEEDIELANIVNNINEESYGAKQAKRESDKEDVDTVSIRLLFASSAEACEAEQWINSLGIEDTEITMKKGAIFLTVSDITPQEYTKIATKYQLEKAIKNSVDLAGKTIVGATDVVNYTATKIIAPTAKIAGEAGMNLGKGLFHTTVKVGAGLVNSTSKAVTDTKVALATDTELLKAKKELVDVKDSAVSFFRKKLGHSKKRSGIEVI